MTRHRYSRVLLLVAIVLACMFVYSAREELLSAFMTVSIKFMMLTFLATLSYNLVLWLLFHVSVGGHDAYLQTSRMFFGAQIAKYVPGKVWGIVYQATLKSTSMPMGNIIQANIVIFALTVVGAAFASAALIAYQRSITVAILVLIAGAVLFVFLFSSDHLYQVLQRLSRVSKRFELEPDVPKVAFSLAMRLVIYSLIVVLYVLSNMLMLYIFFDLPITEATRLTAYLGIAWIAGVVIAITPSGLGIREIVFVGLGSVSGGGSYELYASIAIAARAVQVLQDLVLAFLVPASVRLFYDKDKPWTQKA